jgi:non-canonical (house-cleaning) NTP pyrophosphatase
MKRAAAANVVAGFLGDGRFRLICLGVPSGVSETPHDHDTLIGARNRARACRRQHEAAFCIGLESGLIERYGQWFEEAWAVALSPGNHEALGYSSGLRVPDLVLHRMRHTGKPHAAVMGDVEREHGLPASDTWGNYSGGRIPRQISLEEALRNALVQLLPPPASLYALPVSP